MFHIRSTYDEWAPEFDDYPEGQSWAIEPGSYDSAWIIVKCYLLKKHRWHYPNPADDSALAPFGHTMPLAHYGDTTIRNDAETITISQHG